MDVLYVKSVKNAVIVMNVKNVQNVKDVINVKNLRIAVVVNIMKNK